ncbi:MAG: glycosyltransferase family 2 protein [Flavobacteriales bacterium]
MRISIITPSYNMLDYLKRCRASVADQTGVDVEHIIADGGSTDGTVQWLASNGEPMVVGERSVSKHIPLRYFSGKDDGMYDALNKGFDSASGDVVAWLNCDEQYLEGTLALVAERFKSNPELDMLFGGALLVRPDGSLLAARKSYPARYAQIATSHLYNLSCAMFFRRSLLDAGLRFDTKLRMLGDHHMVMQALKGGARTGIVKKPLSVFAFTGANLSWTDKAKQEAALLEASAPRWIRTLKVPFNVLRLAEKALHGGYHHGPVDYAIYEKADDPSRKRFHVEKVSVKWPKEK